MEAARLLMNRGMGLLLAKESESDGFIMRNINKCVLGAGDARLIARGLYRWRAEERALALGERLYSAAVAWKFRPSASAVCSWDAAREAWLDSFAEVIARGGEAGRARTLYRAVRWVVRRRTLGDISSFAQDPVVRILRRIERCIDERRLADERLKSDWKTFN